MALICVSSKDDNFIPNKEYVIDEGYIYTESDISINTQAFNSEEEAIEELKKKGYEFKKKGVSFGGSMGGGAFDHSIFGDLSSFMGSISPEPSVDAKRAEAESMKNDILKDILGGL